MTMKISSWIQPSIHHPPQTLASNASSPSRKRSNYRDGSLLFNHISKPYQYSFFGYRNLSKYRGKQLCCSCNSSANSSSNFFDKKFTDELQELTTRFHMSEPEPETISVSEYGDLNKINKIFDPLDQPDWPAEDDKFSSISASIEQKAKSVDLPLSLRMIKRKKQVEEGFREVSHSVHCSVKKAFSSMVFIIRELHCFTIQMREVVMYEDLQEILSRVHTEIHASFVWLFQQIFSRTPTLMVYVMILLADYSVYSLTTIATTPLAQSATESVYIHEYQNHNKFDSSFSGRGTRNFSVHSNIGKTMSIGGGGRGGENFRPTLSGTDGDGKFGSIHTIVPDIKEKETVSGKEDRQEQEEVRLWNSIVNEATKMQFRDEALNHETLQMFVSPVSVKVEPEDYSYYFETETSYQTGLAQDPVNPLLLANYAQFLYLVAHEYDRAEEYFKRAVKVAPPDAESMSKYASFLWHAKKDFWRAEEIFLEAMSADPSNSYYAANYSHFLFSTGGEDVCFPDDAPHEA